MEKSKGAANSVNGNLTGIVETMEYYLTCGNVACGFIYAMRIAKNGNQEGSRKTYLNEVLVGFSRQFEDYIHGRIGMAKNSIREAYKYCKSEKGIRSCNAGGAIGNLEEIMSFVELYGENTPSRMDGLREKAKKVLAEAYLVRLYCSVERIKEAIKKAHGRDRADKNKSLIKNLSDEYLKIEVSCSKADMERLKEVHGLIDVENSGLKKELLDYLSELQEEGFLDKEESLKYPGPIIEIEELLD